MLTFLRRSHLIHDLRPYVCTYQQCESAHVLYDRRQDWVEHESGTHRKSWRCMQHTEHTFTNLSAFESHIHEEHADDADIQLDNFLRACESTASTPDRPCPFCAATFDNNGTMECHVAKHLERIARFALPRSTGLEDERDDEDNASGHVEGTRAASSSLSALSNDSSIHLGLQESASPRPESRRTTSDALQHHLDAEELPMQPRLEQYLADLQHSSTQAEEGEAIMGVDPSLTSASNVYQRASDEGREARKLATAVANGFADQDAGEFGIEGPNRDTTDDIWIGVMGPTGSGKSSLIKSWPTAKMLL
jgi:hypothetical protein